MKKICSIIIMVMVLIICLVFCASATVYSGQCGANAYWEIDTEAETLVISGIGDTSDYGNGDNHPAWYFDTRYGGNKVKTVIVEEGITSLGKRFFDSCKAESIILPKTLNDIDESAFQNCKNLKKIEIPDGITEIKSTTFWYCNSLEEVIIPDSVTVIGTQAFDGCENLKKITLPNGLMSLAGFNNCGLTEIKIPAGVKSICFNTFSGCANLEEVTIPASVEDIGDAVFVNCKALKNINVAEGNKKYCSENGVLFNKDKTTLISYPVGNSRSNYRIPDSVTLVNYYAFAGSDTINSIILSENCEQIQNYAFSECKNLKSITCSVNLKKINMNVFWGCESFSDVYYTGTETEWKSIYIYISSSFDSQNGNNVLKKATVHYNYQIEKYPNDYNFYEDSYSFKNFLGFISKEYYTTMFGEQKGTELYNFRGSYTGGHCYGMSLTTAATLIGAPAATNYIKWNFDFHKNLRSVNKGSISYTMGISAKDYIKYGQIYQDSVSGIINKNSNKNNISGLKQAVRDYVNGCGNPVLVDLMGDSGWHTVLAIGIKGEDIIVNDPNVTSKPMVIDFNGNSWNYSAAGNSWNNTNTELSYSTDVITPYLRIVANIHVEGGNVPKDESSEILGEIETYATGMDKIDEDSVLIVDETDSYMFSQKDQLIGLNEYTSGNNNTEESIASLYWMSEGNVITATNKTEGHSALKIVDNDIKITTILPENTSTEISLDENNVIIDTKNYEDVSVIFTSIDNNGVLLDAIIEATASSSTVTATQTDTGLLVTGFSDGTVTLTKDDEVIATEEIKDAVGDIEITYDKEGESEELDADYHTHSYESAETKASTCKDEGTVTYTCSCGDTYTEEIEINPDNHIGETEVRNVVKSTCTEKGYTGDTYCLDCGEKITEGKVTDIKGHKDTDRNYSCDECGATLENNCSHMCHKTGFMGFIWKILRIFFKLFGSQPVCSCGVAHY